MSRQAIPTPVENKGSKPYRIYADVFGDPSSHSHRPVTEAMSSLKACPTPEASLSEVRRLLDEERLPGVPVLTADGELVGVVGWRDLMVGRPDRRAREVMQHALALPAWTPIGKAAAIMGSERVELATVVDYDRRAIGVLSALDVVRWLAREDGYVVG